MCSAYKLNEQGDNIQPWRTPFPIWNQSVVPYPVLTIASWPAYRFLTWGRSDGLVFPSLSEFSTVDCDPYSLVKAMVFPVVMYRCESWTIKKAEHQRIEAFELWCWRRLLRVPWTARRSNQFILKEISLGVHCKDWCWSWNSNTLATWCKELTHLKGPWCWERLKAGERDNRGWDGWMASPTWGTWVWVDSGSWWWTERPGMLRFMQRVGHDWATELNWWTELCPCPPKICMLTVFEDMALRDYD